MSYQGWQNYETWAMSVWLDNDEQRYRQCRHVARKLDMAPELAHLIREMMFESAPKIPESIYSDLLLSALNEVNWLEIAESIREDLEL